MEVFRKWYSKALYYIIETIHVVETHKVTCKMKNGRGLKMSGHKSEQILFCFFKYCVSLKYLSARKFWNLRQKLYTKWYSVRYSPANTQYINVPHTIQTEIFIYKRMTWWWIIVFDGILLKHGQTFSIFVFHSY